MSQGLHRYRLFACVAHVKHLDGPRPMTDNDRAELAHWRDQRARAKRGLPFDRVQPIA